MLHHYQSSNLVLKHVPLITAHVDSVKHLLKILLLLKSVQLSNTIHNSYLQYMTISSQKLALWTKELSQLITVITSSSESPQHQKNILNALFFYRCQLCAACCREDSSIFITIHAFTIIKPNLCILKFFLFFTYIFGLHFSNCNLALTKLYLYVQLFNAKSKQGKRNI